MQLAKLHVKKTEEGVVHIPHDRTCLLRVAELTFLFFGLCFEISYICLQTYTYTHIRTYRHAEKQTYRHADIQILSETQSLLVASHNQVQDSQIHSLRQLDSNKIELRDFLLVGAVTSFSLCFVQSAYIL